MPDKQFWVSGDSWMRLTEKRAGEYFRIGHIVGITKSGEFITPWFDTGNPPLLDAAEVLAEAERILKDGT